MSGTSEVVLGGGSLFPSILPVIQPAAALGEVGAALGFEPGGGGATGKIGEGRGRRPVNARNLYLMKRDKYQELGGRPRRLPFSTVGSAVRTGQIRQISVILPKHSSSFPKSTRSPRIAEGLDSLTGMAAGPRRCPPSLGMETSPSRLRAGPPGHLENHAAAALDCCATAFLDAARPRKPLRAKGEGSRQGEQHIRPPSSARPHSLPPATRAAPLLPATEPARLRGRLPVVRAPRALWPPHA
jgi:hypothetical protein